MGLETLQIIIVVDLDGGVLDGAVHPLGLAIRLGMVELGQPMLDVIGDADTAEDMRAEKAAAGAGAVLGRSAKAMPLSVSTVWIW